MYVQSQRDRVLPEWEREINHRLSQLWARLVHPFRFIKRQFGYTKMRYRWLAKNADQLTILFAWSEAILGEASVVARDRIGVPSDCRMCRKSVWIG